MNNKLNNKLIWMAGVGLAALAMDPALAQDAGSQAEQPVEYTSASGFEEIIITARRREESMQSVPVAVTALTGSALQQRGIARSDDLQFAVPSLRIGPQISPTTPNFIIRGQGRGLFVGALPAVVTYFADVPLPQDGSIVPLYDLSSVQVLKGPQGTLFGRNTTGGAILLSPTRPNLDKAEGYVEGTAGSYNEFNLTAAVNVPMLDGRLAFRVAGEIARRDGFVRNYSGGPNLGKKHTDSVRVSMLAQPVDGVENLLIFDLTHINENNPPIVPTHIFRDANGNPLGNAANAANAPYFFGGTLATDLGMQLAQVQAAGPRVANPGVKGFIRGDVWGIVNTTTVDVTDDIMVKNIFGYRKTRLRTAYDVDGLQARMNDAVNGNGAFPVVSVDAISDELQLNGKIFNDALEFVVGAFYLSERPSGPAGGQAYQYFHEGSAQPIVNSPYIWNKSKALFGQATYHLGGALEGINLTGGYRYTWDDRKYCLFQLATIQSPDQCGPNKRKTNFGASSYTLSVDYQVTSDVLLYAAHRRGYRGGGVNISVPASFVEGIYNPETVNDYEGGIKSSWYLGDMRGRFNFTYYRANLRGFQSSSVAALPLPGGGVLNSAIVANAAKAHTEGMEVEFVLIPLRGLTLSANYDHFKGKFDEFVGPPNFPVGQLLDFKFNTPNDTLNIAGSYEVDLPTNVGRSITFAVNYYWRGDTLISTAPSVPNPITVEPSFSTVDLRVDLKEIAGTNADLSLYVNNVGNKLYRTGMSNSAAAFTLATSYYGDPRTWGARLRYSF